MTSGDTVATFADLLAGRADPGVYAWRAPSAKPGKPRSGHGTQKSEPHVSTWVEQGAQAGWRPVELNGQGVADKELFLRRCAEAFEFPEWFGMNWDALEDSLTDLAWLPAQVGYLVVYDSWAELADADPGSFRTALDVFAEAVESWRDSATPMAVLLPATTKITGLPPLT